MRVAIEQESSKLSFLLNFEEGDNEKPSERFGIGERQASIIAEGFDLSDVHPDLIALSAILIASPFVGKELKIPFPVSERFILKANSVLSKYKLVVESESGPVPPRNPPPRSRPGLAYSGGVDSTAAIAVMPGSTIPIFMNRPMRDGSLYNSEAALASCDVLSEIGYRVERVWCDLEYVRDPVGFPTDVANAVPAIILADKLGLGSISFGTVLESAYGTGHENYRDYTNGSHWTFFSSLFSGAGLTMALPIAGVSEVGTAIIAHKSPTGMAAQSCIRGTWGEPCQKCWKCFRKSLLSEALGQTKIGNKHLTGMMGSKEVRGKLSALPISHENVVAFSMGRIECANFPKLDLLSKRVADLGTLKFLTKWYSPSSSLIPESWRSECIEKIMRYMEPMSLKEERLIEGWDMREFLLSEETITSHKELVSKLS